MDLNYLPEIITLSLTAFVAILLFLLVLSFAFRPLLFCPYLKHMAGFNLKPKEVKAAFKQNKTQGVRDLFLEHYIKADLEDSKEELNKLQEEVGES